MKVVTIIVTFNGMKWIEKCLLSVISQSEVIVIDNNSSDETVGFIKINFPEVILLPQDKNWGFGKANNIGISYALNNGAEAVFLLNQDAYVEKECLDKLVKAHIENPEFGIISPIHLNWDGTAVDRSFMDYISPYYVPKLNSDLIVKNFSKNIYETKFINAAAWLIPRDVFYKVGGFDPIFFLYGEDDNYSQRVLYHGYKIGIMPNATIFHDSKNFSHKLNSPGCENYYNQFLNKVYIKYANINADDYKKTLKLKWYLVKIALFKLLTYQLKESKIYFEKYRRINYKLIKNSVLINRNSKPNYLNLN